MTVPMSQASHQVIHGAAVALALVTQVCAVVFCALFGEHAVLEAVAPAGNETWSLEVNMDHWAHNNWILVDSWTLAWLLEALYRLCKTNVQGPEACNPELHPPLFYLMWASVCSARICSMLLWLKGELVTSFLMSVVQPSISFCMLYTSYSNVNKHMARLAINSPSIVWWMRYLTQSGLALFAWWTLQIAAIHFGLVLKYKAGVPDTTASTIVLTAVLLSAVIWFILQSVFYLKHMRYTFTVYPILILGLGAIFTRTFQFSNVTVNTIYCGCMIMLFTIMSSIHQVLACLYKGTSWPPALPLEKSSAVWSSEGKANMHLHG
ncbi:unnamed protein product [Knipowitschia caucasica]